MGALLLLAALCAQPAPGPELSALLPEGTTLEDFLHLLHPSASLSTLLEYTTLAAQSGLEDSGGLSLVDPPRLSIHGGSYQWTRFALDGNALDDPLFSGAPLLTPPRALLERVTVHFAEGGAGAGGDTVELGLDRAHRPRSALRLGLVLPELGGFVPFAVGLMSVFSGLHATSRTAPPPTERRRFGEAQSLSLLHAGELADNPFTAALELERGERRFNDLDPVSGEARGVFLEPFLLTRGALLLDLAAGQLSLLFEHLARDELFAEAHHSADESPAARKSALHLAYRRGDLSVSLGLEALSLAREEGLPPRELADADGEPPYPFLVDGTAQAAALSARYALALPPGSRLELLASLVLTAWQPAERQGSLPLTFRGAPAGRLDWTAEPRVAARSELRARLHHHERLGALAASVTLEAALTQASPAAERPLALWPAAGARLLLGLAEPGAWRPFLLFARTPLSLDAELAQALQPGSETTRRYGAAGRGQGGAGAGWLALRPGFLLPAVNTAAAGLSYRPEGPWRFGAQGILRDLAQTPWVESAQPYAAPDADGFTRPPPGEPRFLLGNGGPGPGPLYAALELELARHLRGRGLFSLGFTMLSAVGPTARGNGARVNDVGVVRYETAEPEPKVLASTDADRAFLLKLSLVQELWAGLTGALILRYRDGRPFAFLQHEERDGYVASKLASHRGSPLHFSRPLLGPREDFRVNIDVALSYRLALADLSLELGATVSNVLDLGNEISERNTELGRTTRSALELEPPRAGRLTLALEL